MNDLADVICLQAMMNLFDDNRKFLDGWTIVASRDYSITPGSHIKGAVCVHRVFVHKLAEAIQIIHEPWDDFEIPHHYKLISNCFFPRNENDEPIQRGRIKQ